MSLTHLTDVINRMYAQAVEEVLAQHWGHTGLSMGQRYDQPMARALSRRSRPRSRGCGRC